MHFGLWIFFFQLKNRKELILQFLVNFLYDFFVLFYPAINVPSITVIHRFNQNLFYIKLINMEQLSKWLLVHNHWVNFVHSFLVFSLLSLIKRLQWRLERFKIIFALWFHFSLLFSFLFLVSFLLHLTVMNFFFLDFDILTDLSAWATYWLLSSFTQYGCFFSWQRYMSILVSTSQSDSQLLNFFNNLWDFVVNRNIFEMELFLGIRTVFVLPSGIL